jgi:hypothetical protein
MFGANLSTVNVQVASLLVASFHSAVTTLLVSTVHRSLPLYGVFTFTVTGLPTSMSFARSILSWVGRAGRGVWSTVLPS